MKETISTVKVLGSVKTSRLEIVSHYVLVTVWKSNYCFKIDITSTLIKYYDEANFVDERLLSYFKDMGCYAKY